MQKKDLRLGLFAFSGFLIVFHIMLFWRTREWVFAGYGDFASFYATSSLVKAGLGSKIYDFDTQARIQAELFPHVGIRQAPLLYTHPPFQAVLFLPLAYLSYSAAFFLWTLLNLLLLLLVPCTMGSTLAELKALFRPLPILIFLAFFPVFLALLQGQDSILLLLLFTLALLALRRGRELLCGGLLGLGLFKFQIVLPFLFPFLLRRRWKLLLGTSTAFILLVAASTPFIGLRGLAQYPGFLLGINRGWVSASDLAGGAIRPGTMPNLRGALYVLGAGLIPDAGIKLAVLLLSAGLLVWSARQWLLSPELSADTLDLTFALNLVVALLVSFHLNLHDLTLLALPIALLANRLAQTPPPWGAFPMALLALLLAFFLTPLYLFLMGHGGLHLLFWLVLLLSLAISRELSRRKPSIGPNLSGPGGQPASG
jgi:hypothetical protein